MGRNGLDVSLKREQWRIATQKYYEANKKVKVDKRVKHPNSPKQQRQREMWRVNQRKLRIKKKQEAILPFGRLRTTGKITRACMLIHKKRDSRVKKMEKSYFDALHACRLVLDMRENFLERIKQRPPENRV